MLGRTVTTTTDANGRKITKTITRTNTSGNLNVNATEGVKVTKTVTTNADGATVTKIITTTTTSSPQTIITNTSPVKITTTTTNNNTNDRFQNKPQNKKNKKNNQNKPNNQNEPNNQNKLNKPNRRYTIKLNNEKKPSKLQQQISNKISESIWQNDVDKFYDDRDGKNFHKSDCKGTKKALYIGINYPNTKSPLNGCINDVKNISSLIAQKFGFTSAVILTDDQSDPKKRPTYDNIINAMDWLVQDAKPGDSLFFHYSGHGGTARDKENDEIDGFDETILPCDYETSGQILDDDINLHLVQPLPKGCRLTALFDSCHSGTIMDLPYTYQSGNKVQAIENDVRREVYKKTNNVVGSIMSGNPVAISNSLQSIFDGSLRKAAANGTNKETIKQRQSRGDVVQFSGCMDSQTSADVTINKVCNGVSSVISNGAMSYSIIQLLNEDREYTYNELLTGIRRIMKEKNFTQIAQLSTSRPINMNETFRI